MEIPNRPWQKLGIDLLLQGDKWYLLIAHNYSKILIVCSLPFLISKDVIFAMSSSILDF